jgi:hypothetical protein
MPSCDASRSGSQRLEKRLELADTEQLRGFGVFCKKRYSHLDADRPEMMAGNDLFKNQEFEAAAKQYERAYKLACTFPIEDASPHRGKHIALIVSCLNNLATAFCRLNDHR